MITLLDKRTDQRKGVSATYGVIEVMRRAGMIDLTDGIYTKDEERNDKASYERAQVRQSNYLLDEVKCKAGDRILDIGCGYGRILQLAQERGAEAVGITLTPQQVDYGKSHGLNIMNLHYRDLDPQKIGMFTGAIANGSLEHFCHPEQAKLDEGDAIYRELFQIVRSLLKPGQRFATTAIHFRKRGQISPDVLLQRPENFPHGSEKYHFSLLSHAFGGGWYPYPGQLAKGAEGYFREVAEVDGTHDYFLTAQYWRRQTRKSILTNPIIWLDLPYRLIRYRRVAFDMLQCAILGDSWGWQFTAPSPTILYRHTWEAI